MIQIISIQQVGDTSPDDALTRSVSIIISQNSESYEYAVGGLPLDGDLQPILDARFDELWQGAKERGSIPPEKLVYGYPIQAPDFLVATPPIKDNPDEALDEAIAEMEKGEGVPKSLALIALSLAKSAKREREENRVMKAEIEELKEKVK